MNNQLELNIDGVDISIEVRRREYQAHMSRRELREINAEGRCYFFTSGETILENLVNRHSRPFHVYRRYLPAVTEQIAKVANVKPESISFAWSQKAGCGCGCSPGFKIRNLYRYDVFVNLGKPKPAKPNEYVLGDH